MSLKAKLEAVIYAAEEPVTLTQLTSLFAADALEWKAAQAAAAAAETAEVAGELPETSLPLLPGSEEYLGIENSTSVYFERAPETFAAASAADPTQVSTLSMDAGLDADSAQPATTVADESVVPASAESSGTENAPVADVAVDDTDTSSVEELPVDAEAEAKRLARQRDREVKGVLKQLLDELIASSAADGRGVEIREIAGGYRMATKPECHDAVRMFVKSLKPALKLSLPALETLAVIAYKQPVTAPEVNEIRGVESAGVLGSLLARKLIATAGRKPVIGRPILYKTTKEFLLRFGLKDVSELPSMEEFEKMAAIEMEEMEPEAAQADQTLSASEADAESTLESNSPSGVELAESTAEADNSAPPQHSDGASSASEELQAPTTDSTAAMAAEPPAEVAESTPIEAAPAEPDSTPQAETETFSNGEEEEQKER